MTSILAFDTSQQWCSIAICKDGNLLTYHNEYLPRGHSQILLPRMIETLKNAELSFKDIDYITTINGPGSFTGLRAGIAAAQGIGMALGIPVIGIDAFTAYSSCINKDENILVIIDSQKEDLYCKLLSSNHEPIKEACSIPLHKVADYVGDDMFILVGSGHTKAIQYLDEMAKYHEPVEISQQELLTNVCSLTPPQVCQNGNITCEPYYLREPIFK